MSSPLLEPTEIIFVYRNGLLNRLSMLLSSSLLLLTLSLLVEAKGKIFLLLLLLLLSLLLDARIK